MVEKSRNIKIVTEIKQDGQDFTWSHHYSGGQIMTNKFTIGKESEIQTFGGKKFKVRRCLPHFPKPLANFLALATALCSPG